MAQFSKDAIVALGRLLEESVHACAVTMAASQWVKELCGYLGDDGMR